MPVDELRLTRIVCPQVVQLRLRVKRRSAVVRMQHRRAGVTRVIPFDDVFRRIPRFMRIEEIHPQEKRPRLVVLLQPPNRRLRCPARERLRFILIIAVCPPMRVRQGIPSERRMRARLLIWHDDLNRIIEVQQRFIAFLPAMLEGGIESVLESRVEQMRTIADKLRRITLRA